MNGCVKKNPQFVPSRPFAAAERMTSRKCIVYIEGFIRSTNGTDLNLSKCVFANLQFCSQRNLKSYKNCVLRF